MCSEAKRRLSDAGARFPQPEDVDDRMASVLDVLYVMFTEAHHTTSGAPARDAYPW